MVLSWLTEGKIVVRGHEKERKRRRSDDTSVRTEGRRMGGVSREGVVRGRVASPPHDLFLMEPDDVV